MATKEVAAWQRNLRPTSWARSPTRSPTGQYYATSQDMTPFQDDKWLSAVELTLHTMVGEALLDTSHECNGCISCNIGQLHSPSLRSG